MHLDLLDLIFLNRKDAAKPCAAAMPDASTNAGPPAQPHPHSQPPSQAQAQEAATCPVDHKTRDAWLAQARAQQQQSPQAPIASPHGSLDTLPAVHRAPPASQTQHPSTAPSPSSSWTSALWSYVPFTTSSSSSSSPPSSAQPASLPRHPQQHQPGLDTQREVSTIPRASAPAPAAASPSNHELETGADAATGNWVYPSEKMFFEAMKRKGHAAAAADMRAVVPIHNAVNERAWKEIKEWEAPYTGEGKCAAGPRLHSFAGLSTNMSPRARINTLLGYTPPFDRHDWVVDRCGTTVEYVIDFYQGRAGGAGTDGRPSFYLDVRPKLNSWEGVRMRASRFLGLV